MKYIFLFLFLFSILFVTLAFAQDPIPAPADIFTNLGVNVGVVTAIIAFTTIFKSFLSVDSKILKYIAFFPMIIAGIYAFVLGGYTEITQKVTMAFLYAAAAGYIYSLAGNAVKSAVNSLAGKEVFTKVK